MPKLKQSPWTENDLEDMAEIKPEDIKAARDTASPALRKLLDATEQDEGERKS